MKKLVRIKKNGVIGGVLSGFGEYLSIDPVILRVGFVVLLFFDWFRWWLIVGYIVCWIILPSGEGSKEEGSAREIKEEFIAHDQSTAKTNIGKISENENPPEGKKITEHPITILLALLLISIGIFLIFQKMLPIAFFTTFKKFSLAFVLIVIGLLLLSQSLYKKKGE